MFWRCREVGNLLVSLLLAGSFSHGVLWWFKYVSYTSWCHYFDTFRIDVILQGVHRPPVPFPAQMQSCRVFMFGWATCWTNSPIAGDLKVHWYHCYCWIRFLTVTNPHTERATSHVLQVATRWCFNSLLPSLYNTGIWVWINLKVICV